MTKNAPMSTLKDQPGQTNPYNQTFHPLPGQWAKEQLNGDYKQRSYTTNGEERPKNELQRVLAAERSQHEYWEQWQGVTPGKPVYENPRAFNETMQPRAKYGTEGPGYG
jgi:hypothetical protein